MAGTKERTSNPSNQGIRRNEPKGRGREAGEGHLPLEELAKSVAEQQHGSSEDDTIRMRRRK